MIAGAARWVRAGLFSEADRGSAGAVLHFRLWELLILGHAVHYAWTWGFHILRIRDVVLPLGWAQYVDVSVFFGNPLALVNAGVITVLAGMTVVRVGARWVLPLLVGLLQLQYAARFCLGEIPHSANMIGMGVLTLALAATCLRDGGRQRSFAWAATWFFVGLGYTSAALCKLVATGISWSDGRHLWLWMAEKGSDTLSKTGVFEPNLLQQAVLSSWWLATAVLTVGLVTELAGVLLWWPRTRALVAVALIGLHLGIWGTMNILFTVFIAELLVIGLPWGRWLDAVLPVRVDGTWLRRLATPL